MMHIEEIYKFHFFLNDKNNVNFQFIYIEMAKHLMDWQSDSFLLYNPYKARSSGLVYCKETLDKGWVKNRFKSHERYRLIKQVIDNIIVQFGSVRDRVIAYDSNAMPCELL